MDEAAKYSEQEAVVGEPAEAEPDPYAGVQQILCGAAIVLFAAFLVSRKLTWAELHIIPLVPLGSGVKAITHATAVHGTQWNGKSALLLFAIAVFGTNLFFILREQSTDQLVPAIANIAVGAALSAVMLVLIAKPNSVLPGAAVSRTLKFTNEVTAGVIPAVLFAFGILAVGVVQLAIRLRD